MTNADRIRAMTDEELVEFLHVVSINCLEGNCDTDCPLCEGCAYDSHWMEGWLKQEVKE